MRDITVQFGKNRILDGLNLDVQRGEIMGFVGPSGAGKSVLMRTIIGLVPQVSGSIEVFGVDLDAADAKERRGVERRWGVLFQQGALFSSLTVRQNIQFPVREYLNLSQRLMDEITIAKLGMVGLKPEVADRFPSELSGGMIKRVALARALALDPRTGVPGRADFRPRSDRRRRFRRTGPHPAAYFGPDRFHGNPRSRQPLYGLRPDRGVRER